MKKSKKMHSPALALARALIERDVHTAKTTAKALRKLTARRYKLGKQKKEILRLTADHLEDQAGKAQSQVSRLLKRGGKEFINSPLFGRLLADMTTKMINGTVMLIDLGSGKLGQLNYSRSGEIGASQISDEFAALHNAVRHVFQPRYRAAAITEK